MAAFGPTATYPTATIPSLLSKAYTLASAVAAFVLTGKIAKQLQYRVASAGTFTLMGFTTIRQIVKAALTPGAYTLIGQIANQKISHFSNAGTFTLMGFTTIRQIVKAALTPGAYTLIGQIANQKISHLSATGAYVLSGIAVIFTHIVRAGYDRIRQVAAILYKVRSAPPELEE